MTLDQKNLQIQTKGEPKVLIISTQACSYPGIDNAGQKHIDYPVYTYVIRVPDPIIFPIEFYEEVFEMGYTGIFIASCGTDSPFKNTFPRLSKRIDKLVEILKTKGIHHSQIKLTAVCTVCAEHFVKELTEFYEGLQEIPNIDVN